MADAFSGSPDLIWDQFLQAWPKSRVESMTIEEYSQARGRDTFTYWLEGKTEKLGSIWGGSAFKFGIYHMQPDRTEKAYAADTGYKSDGVYAWQGKLGDSRETVFAAVKASILKVIRAAEAGRLEEIEPVELGTVFKWKIASLYQDRKALPILPIFLKPALMFILGESDKKTTIASMQLRLQAARRNVDYWEFSRSAWKKWTDFQETLKPDSDEEGDPNDADEDEDGEDQGIGTGIRRFWVYSPGEAGEHWDQLYRDGIMAIGWDFLGDLRQYPDKESIRQALRDKFGDQENSKKNDTNTCFVFGSRMKPGDVVFAKIGRSKLLGKGVISSEYFFDDSRSTFKHLRKVDWQSKGNWTVSDPFKIPLKTITDISRKHDKVQHYLQVIDGVQGIGEAEPPPVSSPGGQNFWWLNANPKIWNLDSLPIGSRKTYSSMNGNGNKRRIYQHFQDLRPGDLMLGYISTPVKQIVALCKVTQALHTDEHGEKFEFEKIEQFPSPVSLKTLQAMEELKQCEPLINNQGSLFRVTAEEFELIRGIIDEENSGTDSVTSQSRVYEIDDFVRDTGYSIEKVSSWAQTLERKKQIVFFGPPGSGKSYVSERLARYVVSGADGFVDCIQFHPSYSYEEFLQGIRPETDDKGTLQFEMRPGRFMEFCAQARLKKGPCVLIIDEMNRANLSRVFGELMHLLEYRDKEIALAGGLKFSIPANVRLIGTMNTADRSIALVDFALRRRFAFLELEPDYGILAEFHRGHGFDASGLIRVLEAVNAKIDDKNFFIGISFFMTREIRRDLEEIWRLEIDTYLEEFFFGQGGSHLEFTWSKVKDRILG